ncbi:hypothetical protein OUZ56_019020 [Daphnia magna]|uniref:Uncharacterized protein n=1 Tax=Daphnia magna TaxID=35525 RepID=A0ABQ9ZAE8_9CRUS|nr:hypothetical protein OUZ56_019020 [Daphnia magna]
MVCIGTSNYIEVVSIWDLICHLLVDVEKQGLDQQFYYTHLWNVAVVAGHSPCLGLDLSPFVDLEK